MNSHFCCACVGFLGGVSLGTIPSAPWLRGWPLQAAVTANGRVLVLGFRFPELGQTRPSSGRSLLVDMDTPGVPPPLTALLDEYAEAREQAFSGEGFADMHKIEPGLFVGSQRAAGIFFKFEDSPDLRAQALAALRTHRIALIVCCCGEGVSWFAFPPEQMKYECSLLTDGDPKVGGHSGLVWSILSSPLY
jgi:hypothetical protein